MPKAKELSLRIEYDKGGYIRPFINSWNVWTLKKSEFTPAVRKAILHAYALGRDHTIKDFMTAAYDMQTSKVQTDTDWEMK